MSWFAQCLVPPIARVNLWLPASPLAPSPNTGRRIEELAELLDQEPISGL